MSQTSMLRRSAKLILLSLAIVMLPSLSRLEAQEVSGWSSLEWDSNSQTIYGYAETDLDDAASYYYGPAISMYLYDANNNLVSQFYDQEGENSTSVDGLVQASAVQGQSFALRSYHSAILGYVSDCAEPCYNPTYDDFYFLTYFSSTTDYTFDWEVFSIGSALDQTRRAGRT